MLANTEPYPWHRLPRYSAEAVRLQNAARRFWQAKVHVERLRAGFYDLLSLPLDGFGEQTTRLLRGPMASLGADVQLDGSGWTAHLSVEPALVVLLIRSLVGSAPSVDDGRPLPESLRGAFYALAQQLARYAAVQAPAEVTSPTSSGPACCSDFWVRVKQQAFRGRVALRLDELEPPTDQGGGPWPIELPLVIARVRSTAAELSSLEVGDGFLFAESTKTQHGLPSRVELCGSGASHSIESEVSGSGLVLRGVGVVHYEPAMTDASDRRDSATFDTEPTMAQAVLDAPIEVRVELGSVTLAASEWLALSPGDIITTDLPVGTNAVLRASGREVARGSLVDVDGQLGVKIERVIGS